MRQTDRYLYVYIASSLAFNLVCLSPTAAQILPDTTLPENSIVIDGNTLLIEGGTNVGKNLFHSFQEFSILRGNEAFFNNSLDVQNIITRVTGGKASNIGNLGSATGGNVTINASEFVEALRFSFFNPSSISTINTTAYSAGNSGNV